MSLASVILLRRVHLYDSISLLHCRTFTTLRRDHREKNPITILNSNSTVARRTMSTDHSKLWIVEKALIVALIGVLPSTVLYPCTICDDLAAVAVVVHMHWGLEGVCSDYARPIILGNALSKMVLGLLYAISAFTLGSLLYYNHTDIGIGETIRKFWEIKE